MLSSSISSLTPVIVTVCALFQFNGVNVRLDVETVPSERSFELIPIETFAVGSVLRTTVNCAVPPASVVTKPLVGTTVIPATSLSVFETVTSATFKLLNGAYELIVFEVIIV